MLRHMVVRFRREAAVDSTGAGLNEGLGRIGAAESSLELPGGLGGGARRSAPSAARITTRVLSLGRGGRVATRGGSGRCGYAWSLSNGYLA